MPEIVVLDSHLWFWWINQEFDRFPDPWRELIEQSARVGVSPVSCYELALARNRGRLQMPCDPRAWFQEALDPAGIELLALTPEIAARAVALAEIHRDPFDRIIIATALDYGADLASVDGTFPRYPELQEILLDNGAV
jgi:PIN domain nuclease of toxin-antitoxin system